MLQAGFVSVGRGCRTLRAGVGVRAGETVTIAVSLQTVKSQLARVLGCSDQRPFCECAFQLSWGLCPEG